MFQLGIDRFLQEEVSQLKDSNRRIAYLGHPASVCRLSHSIPYIQHSLDVLLFESHLPITCAFGPQHGMMGEKQDNMIETQDEELNPYWKIPVYSLYGHSRRPSESQMEKFDLLLVDLQDLGTRIYTFLTTLLYVMEECHRYSKEIWVLDRPNPIGRPVEGLRLREGWESFVGAAPLPMRHGLTLGEAALYFKEHFEMKSLSLRVIKMKNYNPDESPHFGWPILDLPWINPSPNASSLNMARCYPGSVMMEGTTLSEMRGTTHPLEGWGAPDLPLSEILKTMEERAPHWMRGALIRKIYFEPTFHKHKGKLCKGVQIHTDLASCYQHELFSSYKIASLFLKTLRNLRKDYSIWHSFEYEYEKERLAIDLIHGSDLFREWVEDPGSTLEEFEILLEKDRASWIEERKPYLIY